MVLESSLLRAAVYLAIDVIMWIPASREAILMAIPATFLTISTAFYCTILNYGGMVTLLVIATVLREERTSTFMGLKSQRRQNTRGIAMQTRASSLNQRRA